MTDPKSIQLSIDDGANVLLLNGTEPAAERQSCVDLLSLVDPGRSNLLAITYHNSPDEWLHRWVETIGERPDDIAVICVGETTRSSASETLQPTPVRFDPEFPIVSIPTTDLTELGIAISRFLTEWEANSNQTVVCFDSITALLQWSEMEPAFRFLHVLNARLSAASALAHFHCNRGVHPETTIGILRPLFDEVIESDGISYVSGHTHIPLEKAAIAEALSSRRRRIVLHTLLNTPGYISIRKLADAVVSGTNPYGPDDSIPVTERQRAMTQLHHTDLPKLADAGMVTYDSQENVASLSIPESQVRSFLEGYSGY